MCDDAGLLLHKRKDGGAQMEALNRLYIIQILYYFTGR